MYYKAVGAQGEGGKKSLAPQTFCILNFFIINDSKKKLKNLQF